MFLFQPPEYVMKKTSKVTKSVVVKAASKKIPSGKSNAKRTTKTTGTSTR